MYAGLKIAAFWTLCGLAGTCGGWWKSAPHDTLTFLAVGQGDCAVFRTAGATILVDAGPLKPNFDAGEKIVVPKLRAMGVSSVDLVLLSHPDMDHVGGLRAIMTAYPGLRVGISKDFEGFEAMEKSLRGDGLSDTDVLWFGRDSSVKVGNYEMRLECPDWRPGEPDNDGSMFIRLSNGMDSAVLSGDASSKAEAVEAPELKWTAEVMKAGHHGSKTATSELWIEAVHPKYAVISCGLNNPYGHPHKEVMDRLAADHVEALRTDKQGDIEFDATPEGFKPAPGLESGRE